MIYVGIARSNSEREQALILAAASFCPKDSSQDAAILRKAFLLCEHPGYTDDSPIVVCDEEGSVIASAFLLDCALPVREQLLKGIFISSVSVAERVRGQGLSRLLMEGSIKAATDRGAEIAIVIARRAVDGYYNRFGFWGVSQYSKVTLNISTLPSNDHLTPAITLTSATTLDLELCARIHTVSYRDLIGHCLRTPQMWSYILRKLPYLALRLDIVRVEGKVIAYVIHDAKSNIHEIGVVPEGSACGARSFLDAIAFETEDLTLHLPPTHPFLKMLEGADVSLTLRECPYGGHMARVLKPTLTGVGYSCEGKLMTDHIPSFSETATLLRLSTITNFDSTLGLGLRGSFNIPLLDQI